MKILVIDDNAELRQLVRELLEFAGYEVLEAENGQAGLRAAFACPPDLILCDYEMDGPDGLEVLATLRSGATTAAIPFILMTGATGKAGMRHSMNLGADDYLAKPFEPRDLHQAVEARVTRLSLERRQADKKLSALRSCIAAALPHALKTPLNGILGYADLLRADYAAFSRDEITDMLATIHDSAVSLDRLVGRFLDYTQLVLNSAMPAPSDSDEEPSAPDAAEELAAAAREVVARRCRPDDLVLCLAPGVPAISSLHLRRVAEELLDNACQFSPATSPIRLETRMHDNRYVLTVSDAGRGLTAGQIAATDAFMQFDRQRYEQQGTGLGLAIVRLIATLNGGVLGLQSDGKLGTVATVALPLAP